MVSRTYKWAAVAVLALSLLTGLVQRSPAQESITDSNSSSAGYRPVFDDVRNGISTGNVGLISRHVASSVTISLRGGETGTFSANQAYYVLDDYFKSRRFGVFEFSSIVDSVSNPYATGGTELVFQGSRESAQVYVGLSLSGKTYKVAQLTIY
jgi:Domain of unknown function (DUF4783)